MSEDVAEADIDKLSLLESTRAASEKDFQEVEELPNEYQGKF